MGDLKMTDIISHPFCHLGRPPFRFIAMREKVFTNPDGTTKAGSSCDHCSTGIRWECWVEDADGKQFKVGQDCINKLSKEPKLIRAAHAAKLERQRQARAKAREQAQELRLEEQRIANEAAGKGRRTNWEVQEEIIAAERAKRLQAQEEAKRPDIAELLFDGKRGFCDAMGHRFACGDLPTGNALKIVADILAKKTGGRKHSKAWKQAKAHWDRELGL